MNLTSRAVVTKIREGDQMFSMVMIAVGVFAADLAAVAAIVGSMFLERWLGLSHRMILDCVFVVAASYGVAAWFVGMWLKREMFDRENPPAAAKAEMQLAPARSEARARGGRTF
jgi:hypothetical protein